MKGKFITLEGTEGCGKSTQSRLLYGYLKRKGFSVVYLREPGSTKIGEQIRRILLDAHSGDMLPLCETLLYMACRLQVVKEIIIPALKNGKIVICDRFLDSTLAYQGYGLGVDIEFIKYVGNLVTAGIKPHLTILLDFSLEKGLRQCGQVKDRIEKRPLDYHRRVRKGYLKLARLQPGRIKVIKVDKNISVTQGRIRRSVDNFLKESSEKV